MDGSVPHDFVTSLFCQVFQKGLSVKAFLIPVNLPFKSDERLMSLFGNFFEVLVFGEIYVQLLLRLVNFGIYRLVISHKPSSLGNDHTLMLPGVIWFLHWRCLKGRELTFHLFQKVSYRSIWWLVMIRSRVCR